LHCATYPKTLTSHPNRRIRRVLPCSMRTALERRTLFVTTLDQLTHKQFWVLQHPDGCTMSFWLGILNPQGCFVCAVPTSWHLASHQYSASSLPPARQQQTCGW
jgi:hypothetical protein